MNNLIKTVIEQIHSGELKLDICNISTALVRKFTGLTEGGSSPTVISFAKLLYGTVDNVNRIPIVAKVYLDVRDKRHSESEAVEGVFYESQIYKIINDIIANNHSPNFIGSFGTAICDYRQAIENFSKQSIMKLQSRFRNIYGRNMSDYKMGIIINPAVKDPVTMWERYSELDDREQMITLFQVIFGLAVMSKYRLMHNDLHPGNILMSKSEPVRDYIYVADEKNMYRIKSKEIPYIFDWDLGYSDLYGANKKLDSADGECLAFGWCNLFREKHDLALFLCHFGVDIPSDELKKMYFNRVINSRETNFDIKLTKLDDNMRGGVPADEMLYRLRRLPEVSPHIYKLSKAQIIDLFGRNIANNYFPRVLNAFVKDMGTTLRLHNKFNCRNTINLEGALSPFEILTESKVFDEFRINSIPAGFPEENIFRIPRKYKHRRRIGLDSRVPSTRKNIRGEPMFPERKGPSYVRTRDYPENLTKVTKVFDKY